MKKLIPVIFIIVAAGLAFFFLGKNLFIKDNSYSRAKIVKPVVETEATEEEKIWKMNTKIMSRLRLLNLPTTKLS